MPRCKSHDAGDWVLDYRTDALFYPVSNMNSARVALGSRRALEEFGK
jgi:hypothetical protein